MVDKGIYQLDHIYSPLARNGNIKVAALKTDSAKNLQWHTGTKFQFWQYGHLSAGCLLNTGSGYCSG
jgi:hypothetical protein